MNEKAKLQAFYAPLEVVRDRLLHEWVAESRAGAFPELRVALGKRYEAEAAKAMTRALEGLLNEPERYQRTLRKADVDGVVLRLIAETWGFLEKQAAAREGKYRMTHQDAYENRPREAEAAPAPAEKRSGDTAQTSVVAVRVPHQVRAKLEEEASDLGMTLSEVCARKLAQHVGLPMPAQSRRRGRPKKL